MVNVLLKKTVNLFGLSKQIKDGRRWECKECRKKDYDLNRDKVLQQKRDDYNRHKEKRLLSMKDYYQENKERIKQRTNNYYYENIDQAKATARVYKTSKRGKKVYNNYYHNVEKLDPQTSTAKKIRTQLYDQLKRRRGIKRNISLEETVGCSVLFLVDHLKSTLPINLTWEDYMNGIAVIDHIAPCCSFDLTDNEQLKKCFNYKNLRLIHENDNSTKASRDKLLKFIPKIIETPPNIIKLPDQTDSTEEDDCSL